MTNQTSKSMYGTKSTTDASKKDLWNTKWSAVSDASYLVGDFSVDLASFEHAKKAPTCITPEMDSLTVNWDENVVEGTVAWCNPPFSRKFEFLAKAYQTSVEFNTPICVMIPCEVATKWWAEYVYGKASSVFIPDGRYDFVDNDTKEELKGVPFASCFVLFDGESGQFQTEYIHFKRGIFEREYGRLLDLTCMIEALENY